MKTLLVYLLLCAAPTVGALSSVPVAIDATAVPTDPVLTRTTVSGPGIVLRLANLERQRTVVTITELAEQREIHREVIKRHNGFVARFDCAALPDGRYVISVHKEAEVHQQIILKDGDRVWCSQWTADSSK